MRTGAGRRWHPAYGRWNWPPAVTRSAVTRFFAPAMSLLAVIAALAAVAPSGALACEKHLQGHHTGSDTGAEASGR